MPQLNNREALGDMAVLKDRKSGITKNLANLIRLLDVVQTRGGRLYKGMCVRRGQNRGWIHFFYAKEEKLDDSKGYVPVWLLGRTSPVSTKKIQQIVSQMTDIGVKKGIVIASRFAPTALRHIELAATLGFKLEYVYLKHLMNEQPHQLRQFD